MTAAIAMKTTSGKYWSTRLGMGKLGLDRHGRYVSPRQYGAPVMPQQSSDA
jgi:hypothetical protein